MLKKPFYGLLLLSLVVAVACNSSKKSGGKSVYYNIGGEPSTLSPLSGATDAMTSEVHAYIFDSLLTRDVDTYELKPALATEWKISDDKRIFEFTLRQG